MNTITYKSRTERFFDDFERELHKTGLREAIAELTRRLEALESQQAESSAPPVAVDDKLGNVTNLTESPKIIRRRRGRPKGRGIPKAVAKAMMRCIQAEKVRAFNENRELLEANVIEAFRSKVPNRDASRVFELVRSEWQKALDGRLRIQALTSAIGGRSAAGSQDEAAQNPKVTMTVDGQ
jgi:hypothetical protein